MDTTAGEYTVMNKNQLQTEQQCFQLLNATETVISTGNVDQFGPSAASVLGFKQDAS